MTELNRGAPEYGLVCNWDGRIPWCHVESPCPFPMAKANPKGNSPSPSTFDFYIGRQVPLKQKELDKASLKNRLTVEAQKTTSVTAVNFTSNGGSAVKRFPTIDAFALAESIPLPVKALIVNIPIDQSLETPSPSPAPIEVEATYHACVVSIEAAIKPAAAAKILDILFNNVKNLGGREKLFRNGQYERHLIDASVQVLDTHHIMFACNHLMVMARFNAALGHVMSKPNPIIEKEFEKSVMQTCVTTKLEIAFSPPLPADTASAGILLKALAPYGKPLLASVKVADKTGLLTINVIAEDSSLTITAGDSISIMVKVKANIPLFSKKFEMKIYHRPTVQASSAPGTVSTTTAGSTPITGNTPLVSPPTLSPRVDIETIATLSDIATSPVAPSVTSSPLASSVPHVEASLTPAELNTIVNSGSRFFNPEGSPISAPNLSPTSSAKVPSTVQAPSWKTVPSRQEKAQPKPSPKPHGQVERSTNRKSYKPFPRWGEVQYDQAPPSIPVEQSTRVTTNPYCGNPDKGWPSHTGGYGKRDRSETASPEKK